MRTEAEMFNLIVNTASADERIRAVILSGSRANGECPKDKYQDYDIVYIVRDVKPFWNNTDWIEAKFGKPAIMQLPETMSHPLLPPDNDGHFVYLMLFEDSNRIDLTIDTALRIDEGEPAEVLLDKDGVYSSLRSDASVFHVKKPEEDVFLDACNEFWWCLNNVGKAIPRDELPYAMRMFNVYVRDMLDQMVSWYIGVSCDFTVSAGKMGKYFKRNLPYDIYGEYVRTYCNGDYEGLWASVYCACSLFSRLAREVADKLGFEYRMGEQDAIMRYLDAIRREYGESVTAGRR